MVKRIVLAVVVLAVAAGAALWWFVLRDDAPPELSLDDVTGRSTTSEGTGPAPTLTSLDGTWVVVTGTGTQAGFRIEEDFVGGLVGHQAVGRSPEVDGSVTIAGSEVTQGDFTVDLTALEFNDPGPDVARRASALRTRGLETDRFPEATFTLTSPAPFTGDALSGATVTLDVTGTLTLHGVEREITVAVEARLEGSQIHVVTADPVPIVLADYGMTPPTAAGVVARVADRGSFEFLLVLEPA